MVDAKIKHKKSSGSRQPVKKTEATAKWIYLLLFAFAFILYANTLHHEYAFDDAVVITENTFTKKGIVGIPDLLQKDLFAGMYGNRLVLGGGRWRPLSLVTYALEYQFFGMNPHASHWINVLFYGLAAVILFMMLQKILPGKILLNFFVSLLFIALPVHTEVVANIKSRDEILSFIGLCLAIYWCFTFLENRRIKYLVYSCISYFLALTSKENGITWVVVLPLMLVFLANKKWKESMLLTLPYLLAAAIYSAIRWKLVGIAGDKITSVMDNPFLTVAISEKLATITSVMGKYLLLLIFPWKLSSDYSYNEIPVIGWGNSSVIISLLIYSSLLIYVVVVLSKTKPVLNGYSAHRIAAFGILFYLITISMVINLFFNVGAPMAERFLFLPSLGFCIAAVALILKLLKTQNYTSLKITSTTRAVFYIILILLSVRTIARNSDWRNNLTLFSTDIKNSPNSARLQFGYGNLFREQVEKTTDLKLKSEAAGTAISAYSNALAIYPAYPDPYYNLGVVYYLTGDTAHAINMYLKTLERSPVFALAAYNLGAIYFSRKNYEASLTYFRKALEIQPENFNTIFNSAVCYHMLNDYKNAIVYYQEALRINSSDVSLLRNLSIAYANLGDTARSNYYNSLAEKK